MDENKSGYGIVSFLAKLSKINKKYIYCFASIGVAFIAFGQGCSGGSLGPSSPAPAKNGTTGSSTGALAVSPIAQSMAVNTTVSLVASGGQSPYTYTITSGPGSIAGAVFLAASTAGVTSISVRDSAGSTVVATLTATAAIPTTVLALTPAQQTVPINTQVSLVASGGTPPYTYSISSGGGTLSGAVYTAPNIAGTAVVRVTDAVNATASESITSQVTATSVVTSTFVTSTFSIINGYAPCSSSDPMSGTCSSAIHRYCAAQGYVSGFGPMEYTGDTVYFACIPASGARIISTTFTTLGAYSENCNISFPRSDACNQAVDRLCIAEYGMVSGYGLVEFSGNYTNIVCVNSNSSDRRGTTFATLSGYNAPCNSGIPVSGACSSGIHQLCVSKGYAGGGFGPVDHNGELATMICVH